MPRSPLIGITCEVYRRRPDYSDYELTCDHRYALAVKEAGGHPVLLPIAHRRAVLRTYLEGIDGLVIVGGLDVDPRLYGEKPRRGTQVVFPRRTAFERWLYRSGRRRRLPLLAVCYGMQLVNVLEGGALHQDIPPGRPRVDHRGRRRGRHAVRILPGTRLSRVLGGGKVRAPTEHHQGIKKLAPGWRAAALAADGIVEAMEHPDRPEVLALQWHPERAWRSEETRRLFRAFLRECRRYARDRRA